VSMFLSHVLDFGLTDAEVLQIVNLAPCDPVFYHGFCRDCDRRFTEEQVDRLCDLVKHYLLGRPAPPWLRLAGEKPVRPAASGAVSGEPGVDQAAKENEGAEHEESSNVGAHVPVEGGPVACVTDQSETVPTSVPATAVAATSAQSQPKAGTASANKDEAALEAAVTSKAEPPAPKRPRRAKQAAKADGGSQPRQRARRTAAASAE